MSKMKLLVFAEKDPTLEERCGAACKFLVRSWLSKTARCVAFDKSVPLADGDAYRVVACLRSEEEARRE